MIFKYLIFHNKIYNNYSITLGMGIGDWGLGIGDWGLGIGPNPQSPIPNPQSPIPIPNVYLINFYLK
jgi:hypothetical protein